MLEYDRKKLGSFLKDTRENADFHSGRCVAEIGLHEPSVYL